MNKIIVIEGTDGCGKETQAKKLAEYLTSKGINVLKQDFPNYESASCAPVKMLLNGELGNSANSLDAYQSSILFAVDRLCTFKKELAGFKQINNTVLILDRYVESNLLYQACKIEDPASRMQFTDWLFDLEYGKLKLPKPDLVIYLNVPPKISTQLVKSRGINKNGQKNDIYENDNTYIQKVYSRGISMAQSQNWAIIDCVNEKGELRTIDEISTLIIAKISPIVAKLGQLER